jgi:flagellar hook protein FlgE
MAVIGDNIANVNTVAFKSSRATFQDLLAQNVSTAAGTSQVGRGVRMSQINAVFSQGSFENTSEPTDLAIGGSGFFILENRETSDRYYTRAGQFTFDRDGYLVNPEGYVVQGWKLNDEGQDVGDITDIKLEDFSSKPKETNLVQLTSNLDSRVSLDSAADLKTNWDAGNEQPIGSTNYDYQTSINVYDSLGSEHTVTLYFDRTDTANQYEFLVSGDPGEDGDAATKGAVAGAYMWGVISFDEEGRLKDFEDLEVYHDDGTGWAWHDLEDGSNPPTRTGSNAYPQFRVNFTQEQWIELNLGLLWDAGANAWNRDSSYTSTQYASAATTINQSQNGYGPGFLQNISVDTDGEMTGHYSNGQVTPLYRVTLADFNNPWELTKRGGNLYAANQRTGDPSTGHPGTNGLGSVAANAL